MNSDAFPNPARSDTFAYHKLNDDQSRITEDLRERFSLLEAYIIAHVPPGTRKDRALSELESAAFWAIKSVSHNWTKP